MAIEHVCHVCAGSNIQVPATTRHGYLNFQVPGTKHAVWVIDHVQF